MRMRAVVKLIAVDLPGMSPLAGGLCRRSTYLAMCVVPRVTVTQ